MVWTCLDLFLGMPVRNSKFNEKQSLWTGWAQSGSTTAPLRFASAPLRAGCVRICGIRHHAYARRRDLHQLQRANRLNLLRRPVTQQPPGHMFERDFGDFDEANRLWSMDSWTLSPIRVTNRGTLFTSQTTVGQRPIELQGLLASGCTCVAQDRCWPQQREAFHPSRAASFEPRGVSKQTFEYFWHMLTFLMLASSHIFGGWVSVHH